MRRRYAGHGRSRTAMPAHRSAPTGNSGGSPALPAGRLDRAMIVPRLSGRAEAGDDRHAGLALQLADCTLVVAPRREQQLQIGAREPLAAAAEHHRGGDPEGQRAAAGSGVSPDLAHQTRAARQLVDRHLALDPVLHPRREMVGEVGADPRQLVQHRDPDRAQMLGRADARDLQQVRRVDGAAADDHLARRRDPVVVCRPGDRRRRCSACRRTKAGWRPPWSRPADCRAALPGRERSAPSSRATGRAGSSANSRPPPGPRRCNPGSTRTRPACAASTKRWVRGRIVR